MQRRQLMTAALAAPALALPGCSLWHETPVPPVPPQALPQLLGDEPPPAPRECRAAWVATVANIDWPSRKGLSDAEQIAEIRALLDCARSLKLNAIVLQVRTSADALYRSSLEPWSEYLSGVQGKGPGYDPLAVWLQEAHARGIELHAWLNPYRARQSAAKSEIAPNHVSRTQPDWVKSYGDQLWIDPGEPAAAEHTLAVCRDLLTRYAVDGLHIDDYFYPYPVQDPATRQELDFPDEPSWQRYVAQGGRLPRADWRRDNVDRLVQRLHALVREVRPAARLGISPFGLPRPDLRPAGITGFSQYDKLYAHVEHWLASGWMDYLAPQLYWPRAQRAQAFEPLLRAWQANNPLGRPIWPGLFTSKAVNEAEASWPVDEIPAQIELMRGAPATGGHLHFSMVALLKNRRGLADSLRGGVYAQAALMPEMGWLSAPGCGAVSLGRDRTGRLHAHVESGPVPRVYALWRRTAHLGEASWRFEVLPPEGWIAGAVSGEALVLAGVNTIGEVGPRTSFIA
ncbi:MAG: family 10 glycosylhydrolase [Burkholderiaceae bacterium]